MGGPHAGGISSASAAHERWDKGGPPRREGDSPVFAANMRLDEAIIFAPRKSGQSPVNGYHASREHVQP